MASRVRARKTNPPGAGRSHHGCGASRPVRPAATIPRPPPAQPNSSSMLVTAVANTAVANTAVAPDAADIALAKDAAPPSRAIARALPVTARVTRPAVATARQSARLLRSPNPRLSAHPEMAGPRIRTRRRGSTSLGPPKTMSAAGPARTMRTKSAKRIRAAVITFWPNAHRVTESDAPCRRHRGYCRPRTQNCAAAYNSPAGKPDGCADPLRSGPDEVARWRG